MASVTHPPQAPRPNRTIVEIGATTYEQVSSWMTALLLMLGILTFLLFIVWLTNRIRFTPAPTQVEMANEDVGGGGHGNGLAGGERDFEEPTPEELPEMNQEKVDQSLADIAALVTTQSIALEAIGGETSSGTGEGTGSGDGRGKGPGGPGTSDGIPAWERWEIKFAATDSKLYAQQLDFFKVELGVAGGGDPNVHYVSNLAAEKPVVRVGDPKKEDRIRFLFRGGSLRKIDRDFARKAGINVEGRVVFHFYSKEMYNALLTLENQKMRDKGMHIIDVKRTVFGIRGTAGNFEFHVIDQQYRVVPKS